MMVMGVLDTMVCLTRLGLMCDSDALVCIAAGAGGVELVLCHWV